MINYTINKISTNITYIFGYTQANNILKQNHIGILIYTQLKTLQNFQ